MTKPTKFYLVRHGESTLNSQGLLSGHNDPPLTERGEEQAKATRDVLRNVHFDAAYSSNLQRAVKTAEIIYGQPILASNQPASLRERAFGTLEGMPHEHWDKVGKKQQTMPHDQAWVYKHAPDIEGDHELTQRFTPVLEAIAKSNPGKTVLVVAHGGVIRATLMKLSGFTYRQLPPGSFKNGGYAELAYEPSHGFKVVHMEGVQI